MIVSTHQVSIGTSINSNRDIPEGFSEVLFMQEQVFFGLTTKLQLISLLDIVKAHFVKITFPALPAFFIFYSIKPPSKSKIIKNKMRKCNDYY